MGEEYVVWVRTEPDDIQSQISTVVRALKELVAIVRSDNLLPDQEDVLSSIEREQLIAILEATLIELKAPYVDRGRFAGLTEGLRRISKRAVEREASEGVQTALKKAVKAGVKLSEKLAEYVGISDLWP